MSTNLKSQIRTYGEQLVDSQTPITAADIADLLGNVRHLPPTPTPAYPKSRLWIAVAAGMAVLVLFGAVSLLTATSGTDTPPATDPLPVTSVTHPPDTTAPTTTVALEDATPATTVPVEVVAPPTTVPVESLDEWLALPQDFVGEPGTYRTNEFLAGFSFVGPAGWSTEFDASGLVWLIPSVGDHGSEHIMFVISEKDSVDAVVDGWLGAAQVMKDREIDTVPPVDVVIGGAHGQTLQMRQTVFSQKEPQTVGCCREADQHTFEDLGLPDLFDRTIDFGQPTYVHVLTVGDETVLIWVETGENVALPGVRNEFFDDAQTVLDSIVWRDLLN